MIVLLPFLTEFAAAYLRLQRLRQANMVHRRNPDRVDGGQRAGDMALMG